MEAQFGTPDSVERHLRAALEFGATRQPADRIEAYVRSAELLASGGCGGGATGLAGRGNGIRTVLRASPLGGWRVRQPRGPLSGQIGVPQASERN